MLVLMMGSLHIEDKGHLMIGKLLPDSGWTTVISQAQVLTSSRAQSALNEHHIKCARYAHQVSLMSLHLPKEKAYSTYCSNVHDPPQEQEIWDQVSRTQNPQIKYWSTIMELEQLICCLVWSLSERKISFSISKYVMSSVHGFILWTIQIMHNDYQFMCGIWSSCQRNTQMYLLNFSEGSQHTSSA